MHFSCTLRLPWRWGGGLGGKNGGTAEKMMFFLDFLATTCVRDTCATINPAFSAIVGSLWLESVRMSLYSSNLSRPLTIAHIIVFGFGLWLWNHFHPPLHKYVLLSLGVEAPRWKTYSGIVVSISYYVAHIHGICANNVIYLLIGSREFLGSYRWVFIFLEKKWQIVCK